MAATQNPKLGIYFTSSDLSGTLGEGPAHQGYSSLYSIFCVELGTESGP